MSQTTQRRQWQAALVATVASLFTLVGAVGVGLSAAAEPPAEVSIGAPAQIPAGAVRLNPRNDDIVRLAIALQSRDPSALAAFVGAVSTPGSTTYRHYLAPGEFARRFGATAAQVRRVRRLLQTSGLHVDTAPSGALSLSATGTAGEVSALLHTPLASYRTTSGETAVANIRAPQLPRDVAPLVSGVLGLDDVTAAAADARLLSAPPVRAAAAAPLPAASRPVGQARPAAQALPTACAAATAFASAANGYTAPQIADHYGLSGLYPSDIGAGVTVAVLELEPFDPADVAAYQSCYGTHTSVSAIAVDGGAGTGAGGGEAALDIESIIGLAPGARILAYESPNDLASVYDNIRRIADDDTASVVNVSWGLCEASPGVAQLAALERPVFEQMAAQGQTVLARTGDTGSEGCANPPASGQTQLSVLDPASQPEVTAVGGTSLATATAADTGWSNSQGASGGGISAVWPMPDYQRVLGILPNSTSAPCAAAVGQLCREVPDVSASADPAHGYVIHQGGGWHVVGGTGGATATVAAIVALADARCTAGPLGLLNPSLYRLADTGSAGLVDVATGPNNDFLGAHGGLYPTQAGYDLTSGVGRPNATALAPALCPPTDAAGSGTTIVTPNLVQPDSHATLTFTYNATAGHGLVDGQLQITVPGTWSLPSTDAAAAGYTTSSQGVLSIDGNTIDVRGITTLADESVTVVYGSTVRGGSGASAPTAAQVTTFATQVRTTHAGNLASVSADPAVRVLASGATDAGDGTLLRAAGADRFATAIAAANAAFPGPGSAQAVVLAQGNQFADALAGGPLATHVDGPLLLAATDGVRSDVLNEIERVLPPHGVVYVLGGPHALAPSIDTALMNLGYMTDRLQGSDRYDTAARVAAAEGAPTQVLEADGTNFPDALSAGPAAIITGGAVLLTHGTSMAPQTAAYLAAHPSLARVAIGGPAATADPTASREVGTDRYQTSVLVAQRFFTEPSALGVASGTGFADALAGGPVAGRTGGPLILVPPTMPVPANTMSYFSTAASSVVAGWVFGGTRSVSTSVADAVARALVLVPPTS